MTCSRGGKVGKVGNSGTGGDEEGRDKERSKGSNLADEVAERYRGEFYVDPKCPSEVLRITGFDFVTDGGWFFKGIVYDMETGKLRTGDTVSVIAAREYEKVPLRDYSPWMRKLRIDGS